MGEHRYLDFCFKTPGLGNQERKRTYTDFLRASKTQFLVSLVWPQLHVKCLRTSKISNWQTNTSSDMIGLSYAQDMFTVHIVCARH